MKDRLKKKKVKVNRICREQEKIFKNLQGDNRRSYIYDTRADFLKVQ